MTSDEELRARRERCTRFLGGHGPATAASLLATIPPATEIDTYGQGGVVAELEAEICRLLGKSAAAFLPSGTMAQQAVLRVHADGRHRRTGRDHRRSPRRLATPVDVLGPPSRTAVVGSPNCG